MAIFCPQCGVENPESSRFCDQCGAALIPVAASAPASAPITAAPSASTVLCPQCGTAAIPGEAFCDNCGAPLSAVPQAIAPMPVPPASASVPPQPIYQPPQPVTGAQTQPASVTPTVPSHTPAPAAPRTMLAPAQLVVAKSGVRLPLPAAPEATIGRADPVSRFSPDVDLTGHEALEHGVGRRHLRLFIQNGQVLVEDLDSTNGTLLNGQRLTPRQPQPIHNGDQLQLGRLLLRVQM